MPKKILMRCCADLTCNLETIDVIKNNSIWDNSGNMLFFYSIYKILSPKGVEITPYTKISKEDATYINQNYDVFVIPLANAFRKSFARELKKLTELVKNLTIPCIVIGVGLQAQINPNPKATYEFDPIVKEFCKEILKRSHSIGVRGEFTKAYLVNLGFDEKRIVVTGCPSMYMNGRDLKIKKKKEITNESHISMNGSISSIPTVVDTLNKIASSFPNSYFVSQTIFDLKLIYAGVPLPKAPKNYIASKPTDKMYLENRIRIFKNIPSWFNYFKDIDFSIGARIHGNIAAILSGVPTFIMAFDSRVQELALFHGIPYIAAQDIKETLDIKKIYKELDYTNFSKLHHKNFDNFVQFLKDNNLDHIYLHDGVSEFEKEVKKTKFDGPVLPLFAISKEEAAKRLELYYTEVLNQKEVSVPTPLVKRVFRKIKREIKKR